MADKTIIQPAEPGSVAPLDRETWDRPDIRKATNCYAFAANDPHGHPGTNGPIPGDRHFSYLREISVKEVAEKAAIDGFIPIHGTVEPKPGHFVVALAVAPNKDFHWYRQMDDGTWWHKPGPDKPITNLDYDGNVITDPRTAARRNKRFRYKQFGGFFYVPNEGLKVGITKDQALLRDFEIQEVIELASKQLEERSRQVSASQKADNREFRRRKKEINQMRPRNKLQALGRRLWQRFEDAVDRALNRPLKPRLDPDGALDALSDEIANQARRRERHCRMTEMRELRSLIGRQELRAKAGWRPTPAMLRYKLSRQKGQRHSFVIADNVYSGDLRYTALTVEREKAMELTGPAAATDKQRPAVTETDPKKPAGSAQSLGGTDPSKRPTGP